MKYILWNICLSIRENKLRGEHDEKQNRRRNKHSKYEEDKSLIPNSITKSVKSLVAMGIGATLAQDFNVVDRDD